MLVSFLRRLMNRSRKNPAAASRAIRKRRPALTLHLEILEDRTLMTAGLVAAYNFDQGSGTKLIDVSGNGNNGIISRATWVSNGMYGGALSFDGHAQVDIPDATSLDLTTGMTLEAWVKPASLSGLGTILLKGGLSAPSYALFASDPNIAGNPPNGKINTSLGGVIDNGNAKLPLNQWSFLAETYDGSTLKLYVNGNLVDSESASGNILESGSDLFIGGYFGQYFSGLIDNVRIYDQALPQSQIQTDMNTPIISPVDTPPTVTSVTPADGASGVSTGTAITVQFSEALDPTTVTSSTIQLLNSSGSAVAASVSYNASTFTATLTPSAALSTNSNYKILVHGGSSGAVIKDAADTPLAANFSSTFTTAAPPDHVVIVVEENHSYNEIIGSPSAPYINSLASQGALMTNSFAIEHPSEPNYLDLFSGSNQGITTDGVDNPGSLSTPNLGQEVLAKGLTWGAYIEGLTNGVNYDHDHAPWDLFNNNGSPSTEHDFSAWPTDFTQLPQVSIVTPNLQDDMHDGTIQQGDTWLQNNIDSYAQWAKTHNSVLIVTWDEDDGTQNNQIPTIIVGQNIVPGQYNEQINHFNVLRTIEDMYGLSYAGSSATATPITDIWSSTTSTPPAAPSNLAATAASTSQINLTWTDNASNATGVKVDRSTDGINFTQVALLGASATSYSDTGLVAATTYYYEVVATNSAGDSSPSNIVSATTPASSTTGPVTSLHYAPNSNFDANNNYVPAQDGFNLADASSVDEVNSLPSGDMALVYIGMGDGVTSSFVNTVTPFIGNSKVYGFYLYDEPDPTVVTVANLKAESDWIHTNDPGAKTFITLMNMGTDTSPTYMNTYNSANTDIDLFGLDPYPVQTQFSSYPGSADYNIIPAAVSAAEAWGITQSQIVPVYQAFGGGGYSDWILPTASQEQQILATWAPLVPTPVFDYAYSWGIQNNDSALVNSPDLQSVFAAHNATQTTPLTAATNATATFSASTQDVTLNADVSSGAGAVNAGTVTFTVLQGSTFALAGQSARGEVIDSTTSAQFVVPLSDVAGNLTVSLAYVDDAAPAHFAAGGATAALYLNLWNALLPAELTFSLAGEADAAGFSVWPFVFHYNS
jgi:hypothetical protein